MIALLTQLPNTKYARYPSTMQQIMHQQMQQILQIILGPRIPLIVLQGLKIS